VTTILLRPDAGSDIGVGHLRRCLSVAAELGAAGVVCVFALADGPGLDAAAALVRAAGHAVTLLGVPRGGTADRAATAAAAVQHRANVIVVDSYAAGADFLVALREAGLTVASFDDLCAFPSPARLVINGGLGSELLPYTSAFGDTEFLLGSTFAPLDPGIAALAATPRVARVVPCVVIAAGGADTTDFLPAAIAALEAIAGPIEPVAIIGPLATNAAAVAAAAGATRHPVTVLRDPHDIHARLHAADLAISAGGGTLMELAALGTPAVAVEVAGNQRRGIAALAATGAVISAGRMSDPAPKLAAGIVAGVVALLASAERRAAMGAAGRRAVDGHGARQIAERLVSLCPPASCGGAQDR